MRIISAQQKDLIAVFIEETRETARRHFEQDGACAPVAVFLTDEKRLVVPLGEIINHKDATALFLNAVIERVRPLAFIIVTEAWVAKADPEKVKEGQDDLVDRYGGNLTETGPEGRETPKDGVTEAVMVQVSSLTGDNYTLTAEIVRGKGKPTLKAWERMENRDSEGRFIFNVTPLSERQ